MRTAADVRAYYDSHADEVDRRRRRHAFYHGEVLSLVRSVVPPGTRILDVGCGTGDLLAALRPSRGLGVDLSSVLIERARARHKGGALEFRVGDGATFDLGGETFDHVVLSNVLGEVEDIWALLRNLRRACRPETRLVLVYYNYLWEPLLKAGEAIGLRARQPSQNWLSIADLENLLRLAGFSTVRAGARCLIPIRIPLLSDIVNRWLAPWPLLRHLGLVTFAIARPAPDPPPTAGHTVSVVVPCRNEAGNVEDVVRRIPHMGRHTEVIFVDGASTDGTVDRIREAQERYRGVQEVRLLEQPGPDGKKDAVVRGFRAARGEILMILDADLTVAPEDLPKFYLALAEGRGEFANGSRLVYAVEPGAMRTLNLVANAFFARCLSFLLSARVRDTLCGTKALFKRDWERMQALRAETGDPFGDFDLLFGAARLGLEIVEVPVRYRERTYGETKIRRFRHGLQLVGIMLRGAGEVLFQPKAR